VESELIHSLLFTQNSGDGAAKKKKKKKKKKEQGWTCGGFEAVLLAVADRRTAWMVVGLSSSSLCFFFYSVLLCFCFSVFLFLPASVSCFSFLLLFLMVAAVVGCTAGGGGVNVVAQWLWQPVLLFFSFFTLLQQGRKMVRG
jgi:hypothetical protein